MAVEHHTFASTNLLAGEYETETGRLTIEFHDGARYQYQGVPADVWDGLRRAPSAGQYFHRVVKPRFAGVSV